MNIMRRSIVTAVLFIAAVTVLSGKGPRGLQLVPGEEVHGIIRPGIAENRSRTYILDVPSTTSAMVFRITEATADLDLFLRHGKPMESYDEADFYSETEVWREELQIYKAYETFMPSGRYYLDVAYQLDTPPRRSGGIVNEIPFTLNVDLYDARDSAITLEPDEPVDFILNKEEGYISHFSLEVPRGVDSFRIDVLESPGDVDLLLSQGEAAPTRDAYTAIADTYLGRESLLVEGTGRNGVTGVYYLSVLEASETDYPVPVRLVATYGSDVPDSAPAVPVLTGDEYGADSVRLATVQLISPSGIGSGCIVSGDGKILTNHHVVVDDGGVELPELIVAVAPSAFDVPVESFSAEVIRTSPKDDLALLRITGDRWGRPLPAGYRFPFWRLGDPLSMELGDPLFLMGFPWMGSGLSRSYFTLTRGILSGGEHTPDGLIYKSDAVISGGSSGGAVSDESWRLLGLPSFVVSDEAAQLTYFVPVTRIPRDWRRLFGYE